MKKKLNKQEDNTKEKKKRRALALGLGLGISIPFCATAIIAPSVILTTGHPINSEFDTKFKLIIGETGEEFPLTITFNDSKKEASYDIYSEYYG